MTYEKGADVMSIDEELEGLPPLISVDRAAKLLGFSRASAYRYVKAGELPSRRFGGRVYVVTARLRALIDVPERGSAA